MTWDEIRAIHEWLPASSDGWAQHPFGGGWVQDTASVAAGVYVGPEAVVRGFAVLTAGAVEDRAIVGGFAAMTGGRAKDSAVIGGSAMITGNFTLAGNARMGGSAIGQGDAVVDGEAVIGGNTVVGESAQITSVTVVSGTVGGRTKLAP